MPNIVIKANVSLVLNGETWIKDIKIHTLEVEEQ